MVERPLFLVQLLMTQSTEGDRKNQTTKAKVVPGSLILSKFWKKNLNSYWYFFLEFNSKNLLFFVISDVLSIFKKNFDIFWWNFTSINNTYSRNMVPIRLHPTKKRRQYTPNKTGNNKQANTNTINVRFWNCILWHITKYLNNYANIGLLRD